MTENFRRYRQSSKNLIKYFLLNFKINVYVNYFKKFESHRPMFQLPMSRTNVPDANV